MLTTSVLAQCTLPDADALLSAAGQVVVAAHSGARTAHWAVNLEKGARDRAGEDAIASRLLLLCLAHAARLPAADSFNVGLRAGGDGEVQVGRCKHIGRMCYARCLAAPASGLSARPKGCWNVGAGTRGGGSQIYFSFLAWHSLSRRKGPSHSLFLVWAPRAFLCLIFLERTIDGIPFHERRNTRSPLAWHSLSRKDET